MSNLPANIKPSSTSLDLNDSNNMFVTMMVGEQLFGIPVLQVQDVLGAQKIARIPLSQPEVAGSLNLRGRIVTAIDVRIRLGMPPRQDGIEGMNVVVELNGELYSLLVDRVGEVMSLSNSVYEKNPPTLSASWQSLSTGVYRLEGKLLIVLDVIKVLQLNYSTAA